jgi:hypothetical protein
MTNSQIRAYSYRSFLFILFSSVLLSFVVHYGMGFSHEFFNVLLVFFITTISFPFVLMILLRIYNFLAYGKFIVDE